MANATDIVGALHQDRHSGIMGVLGAQSPMIPVTLKVRSLDEKEAVLQQKDFHFNVFVHQKWTPYLMMLTLYNSVSQLNDFADEATYRLSGKVEMNGQPQSRLSTMQATGEMPHARAHGAGGLVGRQVQPAVPEQREDAGCEERDVTVDLLPERRVATIENAWVANTDVQAGRRGAGEGFAAAVSRRTDPARSSR